MKFTEKEYEKIKAEKQECFDTIEYANLKLKRLREKCDHPKTELVTYSTRPGQYWDNTEICSFCGELVNWPQDNWRHKPKDENGNV